MDVNKRNFFKKQPNIQFKRKGVGIKKGNCDISSHEQSFGNSQPSDTVYRILCPSRKIGGVIGKGGNIVKALRDETQAKITVADSVPGSEERVIIIFSSPTKRVAQIQNNDETSAADTEKKAMVPYCAAQDALLKVHDRIIEEDRFGGMATDDDIENNSVTTRLLVPNNMVGCLLGKRGDVIQRLRSETGANIRVLPSDRLPPCAMNTDELVQISGKQDVAKRALYEVSTLLHQNPRKDKPPSSFPLAYGGKTFHSPAAPMAGVHPPENSAWLARNSSSRGMHPTPWMGGYGDQPTGMGSDGFNSGPPGQTGEASAELSMKILCSAGKIGGVIGKGGFNVKQLQQETGASIHVEDASTESDERVIRISAFEGQWNTRSQTIDAILQLQNKTSEFSEKGTITTRLLVPSSKVGCILGQGGHVINEMRRRTQADIRVYSKDDKPKCASEDEELVQISGDFGVAKDALIEIASRLRARTLRDANVGAEPAPVGPFQRLGGAGGLPGTGPPPSGPVRSGNSSGYESLQGGYDYEPPNYPAPPSATGYPNSNSAFDPRFPNKSARSVMGPGGSNILNVGEVAGARFNPQNPHSGGSDYVGHIRGSLEHFMTSSRQSMAAQPSSYQNIKPQQSSYQTMGSSHQISYQNRNVQQSPYDNMNPQHSSYMMHTQQGAGSQPYHQTTHTQSSYYNTSAQQGTYPF